MFKDAINTLKNTATSKTNFQIVTAPPIIENGSIFPQRFQVVRANNGETPAYYAVDLSMKGVINDQGSYGDIRKAYLVNADTRSIANIPPMAVKVPKQFPVNSSPYLSALQAAQKDALYTSLLLDNAFSLMVGDLPYTFMPYFKQSTDLFSSYELFLRPSDGSQSTLNFRHRLKFFMDLLSQLYPLHANGIVHKDISNSNVLMLFYTFKQIELMMAAQLIDPGLAENLGALAARDPRKLYRCSISGSRNYMAPEIFHGQVALNSDIFSLAGLAYIIFGVDDTHVPRYKAEQKSRGSYTQEYAAAGYGTRDLLGNFYEDPQELNRFKGSFLKRTLSSILLHMQSSDPRKRPSVFQLQAYCKILDRLCQPQPCSVKRFSKEEKELKDDLLTILEDVKLGRETAKFNPYAEKKEQGPTAPSSFFPAAPALEPLSSPSAVAPLSLNSATTTASVKTESDDSSDEESDDEELQEIYRQGMNLG